MTAIISFLIGLSVFLLIEGVKIIVQPTIGDSLPALFGESSGGRSRNYMERSILPQSARLAERWTLLRGFTNPTESEKQLQYAGRPYEMDSNLFYGFQLFCAIVGGLIGMLFLVVVGLGGFSFILIGLIAGFFYPLWWLRRIVQRRQRLISLAMADFLDMLSISVNAGMGFDPALKLIQKNMVGPLSEELGRLLREMEMGQSRSDAFQKLVDRNTSDDLRIFVDALLQAEELGTPLAGALGDQAQDLRIRRVNRAKEEAAKASPRISLITVFIIAPSTLILFITALVLSIFFGDGFGFVR